MISAIWSAGADSGFLEGGGLKVRVTTQCAKCEHSRGVWGHAPPPPRKIQPSEIEFDAI